ncbi:hypothetical protein PR202_gb29654 [Eleusine coracana subsp. coracana]|uniref:Uncharacterized protein n=1 Tax=Eleusine coracana subsp. coracana TaxID=191504 RepID=A0AAV5FZL6_ELECO|nr:hypothetical protein PR202_gb29654 [Eleusine coracana subsp. coracana]
MGNVLRCFLGCFEGEEDHVGGEHYPYCRPISSSPYQQPYYSHDQPSIIPPRPHQQGLGSHGVTVATAGVAAQDQYILNFKSTSMDVVPNFGHLQGSTEVVGNKVVPPGYQCNTEDIDDESSAEGLCDAESYAKANAMLVQVLVLGTTKTFWRLSDKATRISRKLALILRSYHSVGKYLSSFLQRPIQVLIRISGGDITNLPPDYKEFLALLVSNTLTMKDEFLIVNNSALLPMSNRTEVFLMLYDRIVTYLGRTAVGQAKKNKILSKLPYKKDWLDTAIANTQINQWVINVKQQYKMTQLDQLRLNRNVRSHLRQYNDENIEEILYCEWPELLMGMVKMLHKLGELQDTHIQNKFG